MNKFVSRIMILAIMLAFPLMETHAEDSERTEAEKAFRKADIINDGRIDAGEFDMYHQRVFRTLETTGDGILTLDECAGTCFAARPGDDAAAPSGTLHYKFEAIDADGNGQLAEYEYILYARERFGDYDTNKDGVIDINEFCAFYRESMPCTFTAATDTMGK
jgi:Ca2+-binding EF-hand superfamily protein